MSGPQDIDWNRLDRTKFLVVGAGLFSGVTLALFPLSVIKTRQMALEPRAPTGLSGAAQVARDLVRADGVPGLYRGFGTVVVGILPARMMYLTTLESVKTYAMGKTRQATSSEATAAAAANFLAGGTASLITQSVIVPVDVVSQRLMVAASPKADASGHTQRRATGLQIARQVLQREGVRGLYRGFGLSIATFVPSSAVWWSAYGGYQKALWQLLDGYREQRGQDLSRSTGTFLGVQTASSLAAGLTSACITNPLDVIKTRLQVAERETGGAKPTFAATARSLLQEDGPRGLLRGLAPRMVNVALWGTAMVTCYEFLKRLCVLPEGEQQEDGQQQQQLGLA